MVILTDHISLRGEITGIGFHSGLVSIRNYWQGDRNECCVLSVTIVAPLQVISPPMVKRIPLEISGATGQGHTTIAALVGKNNFLSRSKTRNMNFCP